jgi:predicted ATPase
MPTRQVDEAEACFTQSLELSRHQGALAWELRTSMDLAALWAKREQFERARQLLQPILAQFAEGSDTTDVKAARCLLPTLA